MTDLLNNKEGFVAAITKDKAISIVPGGNSMWPFLLNHKQSVIILRKEKGERLKEMDVALFTRGDKCVLHRVMKVEDNGYIFCGDSQTYTEFAKEENVLGVMLGFYRGKTYIPADDKEYCQRVSEWYADEKRRRRKISRFYFRLRVKSVFRRIFKGRAKTDELS